MKKFYTFLTAAAMACMMFQPAATAQTRPGNSSANAVTRPGQSNVRPGSSSSNNKPGNVTTTRPGNTNTTVTRPGSTPTKPGSTATRPGSSVSRPGTSTAKPGVNVTRPGNSTVVRPGQSTRPAYVNPPTRPNRLPSMTRPVPVRPTTLRPGAVAKFRNTLLGLNFGITMANSLNYLYNSSYSVDGYGSNEVYLRNVNEMNYTWTDATLFYNNRALYQSMFYESTIGYNTSRYYGVYNSLRSLYGNPATRSNNGRNLSATWWCYDGEYITLEYSQLNSSNGYRYFTILTYGR